MLLAACSDDDDAAPATASSVPATSGAPSAAPPPSTAVELTVAPTAPPSTLVTPPSSAPDGSSELADTLLDREQLELAGDWVTRDLDPRTELDPALEADFDPFLGLVECPDGVLREGPDVVWAERSIVSPSDPADDGLLSVRMTIERESEDAYLADVAELAACTPTNPQVLMDVDEGGVRVTAAPTAEVAFPSAFSYTVTHAGEWTVSVLMYGLDLGHDWDARSDLVAEQILDRAD
jgi:hypothetical protein